jgi:hypothetical protein
MASNLRLPSRAGAVIKTYSMNGLSSNYYLNNEAEDTNSLNWYPSSTVSFIPAVLLCAILKSENKTIDDNSKIKFPFPNLEGGAPTLIEELKNIIIGCIEPSNDQDYYYNLAVLVGGHKNINNLLVENNYEISLNKPYSKSIWSKETGLIGTNVAHRDYTFKSPKTNLLFNSSYINKRELGDWRLNTQRDSCANLSSLLDFMKDFYDEKIIIDDYAYGLIEDELAEEKAVNSIFQELKTGLGNHSNYYNYWHSPGFAWVKQEVGAYVSDCVYMESTNPIFPSYGIAMYGFETYDTLVSLNKVDTANNMLSSNFYEADKKGIPEVVGSLIKNGVLNG